MVSIIGIDYDIVLNFFFFIYIYKFSFLKDKMNFQWVVEPVLHPVESPSVSSDEIMLSFTCGTARLMVSSIHVVNNYVRKTVISNYSKLQGPSFQVIRLI